MTKINYQNDSFQIPRLLAEISMAGLTDKQYKQLTESTQLNRDQIDDVLYRAEQRFDQIKRHLMKPELTR